MTDMRATERLLEVIEYQVGSCLPIADNEGKDRALRQAVEAVQELRRRGDTLVRAEDLRTLIGGLAATQAPWSREDSERLIAAVARLENALGGKL